MAGERGNTERLAAMLRPVARAIHRPEDIRRQRRVDAAITDDGRASGYALAGSLGRLAATWYVAGTLAVTTNAGLEYRVPADGVIERFDCSVKTAPTGQAVKVRLRRSGQTVATATIPAGAKTGGTAVLAACSAGDVLTIDVAQVGSGTAGANLSVTCAHREERGD